MENLFSNYKEEFIKKPKSEILDKVNALRKMHKNGSLGGNYMPEDSNPTLESKSRDNFHFFTLPMALNYQRNSYALWVAAKKCYEDPELKDVFDPLLVIKMSDSQLKDKLTKYKVVLQPNKQTKVWRTICETICTYYNGDIRQLFTIANGSVKLIKEIVQIEHKKGFPYLSGNKICNYWLYVMENYTDQVLIQREYLNVAPDTHVTQATFKLGLLDPEDIQKSNVQELVINAWTDLLKDTKILPIDIHTPLWLWSRGGFISITKDI